MADTREAMRRRGVPVDSMDDDAILSMMKMFGDMFRDNAPTSAAEAATVILDGVRENRWRILIGDDARKLDEAVRANPEHAYDGGISLGTLGLAASSARAGAWQPACRIGVESSLDEVAPRTLVR